VQQNYRHYRIEAVDRALLLIRLLNEQGSVSVSEAAAELGVAPSSAHRLLATLCYRGFAV
jgi:IclR family transcriptional regulator, acetate operon repressor